MAEEGSGIEAEGLEKQLQTLICHYSSDELRGNSKRFCLDYCELVEESVSRWQMPLPRLRILEKALCHFARASSSFTSSCDHVLRTLSSLALSVFELLLFFEEKDFLQEPLICFRNTFQECHLALARYQNAHLLQVDRLVRAGGAWASTTLQAILSESNLPQDEVDVCLSSELPVFFELRVRYLLSCERVTEALALAKYCIRHPTTGQHSFFLKVYLTWLYKSSQHDRLREELADLSSKDAVHIICNLEYEETNELLLALCQMFLSQKLCQGDLYYMCELVFVWSKLHTRLNTSKQAFFEESRQLMLCATNVNSIFPFIRVVLQELGEDGLQFCVELCANALKSCLPCDAVTKSLIYKTIAGLLHKDLEVCRACALLVFFMERSLEAYKMVYLHYMLPDQEYPVEHSPVSNQIRFETLQVLKKDLYFDPEFWNLITLRTNCLKLMSKKVVDAALEEIVEEKWITNYCSKEFSSTTIGERDDKTTTNKRNHKEGSIEEASKRLKFGRLTDDSAVKKKGNHGPQYTKRTSSQPLRRSFWQLDRIPDVANGELRRATRLSDKNPPKRIIQKPKWLLEDSATLQESKRKKQNQSSSLRKPESGQLKNNSKPKVSVNSCITHQPELHPDSVKPSSAPQVILELSLPDNELMGTFNEDTCNRQKGYPQMLYYKPTVKIPDTSQPVKVLHGKEVILRARDLAMFVQQLHCYAQGQKGKGNGSNIHGSVSTITRSSAHGSPPKEPQRGLCEEDNADTSGVTSLEPLTSQNKLSAKELTDNGENKEVVPSQKSVEITESIFLCTTTPSQSTDTIPHTVATSQELYEEPSVEMKVTFASQSPAKDKATQQPTQAYTELSQTFNPQSSPVKGTEQILPVSTRISVPTTRDGEGLVSIDGEQQLKSLHSHSENGQKCIEAKDVQRDATHTHSNNLNDISTLKTEMDTQFPLVTPLQDTENHKKTTAAPIEVSMSVLQNNHNIPDTSSRTVPEPAPSASMQCKEEKISVTVEDDGGDDEDFEEVESEESSLEYCCTFCQKVFKGRRVVVHAMFHFRKDECMFCGTMFKDDLLAMMHLSDHIEKLKRSKECPINKAEQERVSETKDLSAPKSSAKAKAPNRTSGNHKSRKLRKPPVCSKTVIQTVRHLSESRSLRSMKKTGDGLSIQKHKQNDKRTASKSPAHRSNGYLDKKRQHDQIQQATLKTEEMQPPSPQVKKDKAGERKGNHDMPDTCGSSLPSVQKRKHLECSKNNRNKDTVKTMQKKKEEPLEKLHCPADGCNWSTDLSKKRVALLYHALERHYGDIKPLELSFQVANNKCSICMRVLWSFEHFQHHVERHLLCPRHPCLHLGCTARFKSGMEMRRHTRKHSPLQAVCCFPGCSELFICLWALNLHEREHYASKRTKPIKSVDLQTENKPNSTKVKKIDGDKPNAATMTTEETLKEATRKLRGHASHNTTEKHVNVPPPDAKMFVVKQQLNVRKESKDSNVLKNLSNKASTTSPANYRLNLRVRKGQTTKANPMVANTLKSPFPGHRDKLRHRLNKKQVSVNTIAPRKRGRPPKSTKATYDENKTVGKNSESPKDNTPQDPLARLVGVSSKLEIKEKHFQDSSKTTEISHLKSVSKKSLSEDTKSNRVEQNKSSDKASTVAAQNSVSPTENSHKLILHNLKKLCAAKATDSSGASKAKKQKLTTQTSLCLESKIPVAKSTFVVPKVDGAVDVAGTSGDDHGNKEKTLSSQDSPADCPQATAKSANQKHTAIKKKKSQSSEGKLIRKKGGEKKVDGTTRHNLKRKSKEEPLVATSESTSSTMTNVHAKNPQNSLSASKKNNSSKDVQIKRNKVIKGLKESKTKTAQSEHPNLVQNISTQLPTESKTEVKPDPVKSCAGGQEHVNKTPECAGSKHHHFLKPTEDEMSTFCIDTLAEYGKKHIRAPPTAYLDEKYTTMPKRRQGVSFIHSSDMTTLPKKNRITTAVPQRQRCANCFTTYSSAKELQNHLKLQRCSSLFGFDSDDEGNS